MITITITKEQLASLNNGEQVSLETGYVGTQPILMVEKEPKKWEPQGGSFYISTDGIVREFSSSKDCCQFGLEYPTRVLAEKAASIMRRNNRMLNYILEHAPEHDPEGHGYFAYKNPNTRSIARTISSVLFLQAPYTMPEAVCEELCRRVNDGEVDL